MYHNEFPDLIYIERQIRLPSFQMSYEHFHPYYELFYLKSGKCTYTVDKKHYQMEAGDLFIVPPGCEHSTKYEGNVPCERVVIYCRMEQFLPVFWNNHPDILPHFQETSKILVDSWGQQQIDLIFNQMIQEHQTPSRYSEELTSLLLMELLLVIDRSGLYVYEGINIPYHPTQDIEDALRFIDLNYAMPITLEDVASHICLSPTYLSKKFHKVTGSTFKEYLNYIRIRQACQSLLTTDDSITKIALNCGFSSSNYFKDLFRKINGVSPREYRKRSQTFSFDIPKNA